MKESHILPATEVRNILSILNAHKEHPRVPWGITAAGWHAYCSHWNKEVRDAAEAHPYCGRPAYQLIGPPVRIVVYEQEKACA